MLAAQKNALGFNEGKGGRLGKNQNAVVKNGDATLLHMTRSGVAGSDMVLMTQASGASAVAQWASSDALHNDVVESGTLDGPAKSKISTSGKTVNGAISAPLELAPGESKSVTYVLTWYFKGGKHGSGKSPKVLEGEGKSAGWGHSGQNYTNWWPSALGVAEYLQENLTDLTDRTRLFHDTLYESTLPVWFVGPDELAACGTAQPDLLVGGRWLLWSLGRLQ